MLPDRPELAEVAARYDEPHRRYHDRRHLERVLDDVERLLPTVEVPDPDAVRLAALFHDAVYDPWSTANEAASAALAAAVLSRLEPPDRVAHVQRLVLATARHRASYVDEGVLLDADLAILATDRPTYVDYVRAVRAEYADVPQDVWQQRRAEVLRSLLDIPRLFTTPAMHVLEEPARQNVAAELAALGEPTT
jgi:predicted metal-dependent HD superfamily phosphohydrolase